MTLLEQLGNPDYKQLNDSFIDACIADILSGNGSCYTDDQIINLIKGLCYSLVKQYYDIYDIQVLDKVDINKCSRANDETLGITNTYLNVIMLEKETLLRLRNGDIDIINTVMHEVRHVRQHYLIETNEISFEAYQLMMEKIISTQMNDKYYNDNYDILYDEVDAIYDAETMTYRYIKKICPELAQKMKRNSDLTLEKVKVNFTVDSRRVRLRRINKEELLDRIVKGNPELLDFYPLLSFYYYEDGTKIAANKILERCACDTYSNDPDSLLAHQIIDLDYEILKRRSGTKSNIKKDLLSLEDAFLIMDSKRNPKLDELRKNLIELLTDEYKNKDHNPESMDIIYDLSHKTSNIVKFLRLLGNKITLLQFKIMNGDFKIKRKKG